MNTDPSVIKIEDTVKRYIAEWNMLPSGSKVVAGFSGGADSVVLLHFLWNHQEEYSIKLLAVHVNHLLRGEESSRDEKFVEKFCKERGISFRVFRRDAAAEAAEKRLSVEESGREIRYSCFKEAAIEWGENVRIATAHTASDLAETVLLNLIKGSGIRGLQGIPPVRENIVRPLLSLSRKEIELYCKAYQLSYCIDSTNLLPEYDRNRIRLNVIPYLKELQPSFEKQIMSCTKLLREDDLFLQQLAERELQSLQEKDKISTDDLLVLPAPIRSRVLKALLEIRGAKRLSHENILAAEKALLQKSSVTVSGGIHMDASGEYLRFRNQKKPEACFCEWCLQLEEGKAILPDGRRICLSLFEGEKIPSFEKKINNLLFINREFYDRIQCAGLVRNRRSGDVFRPAGRNCSKTVKKLFNEKKIPLEERESRVFLEDPDTHEILWIEGIGPSESCVLYDDSQEIIWAEIQIYTNREGWMYGKRYSKGSV